MPVVDEKRGHVEMDPAQLAMLLGGIDLNARRLRAWAPSINSRIDGESRS